MITVSWTEPSMPPTIGYSISVDSTDINIRVNVSSSPQNVSVSQAGVYTVRVTSISQHYPGGQSTPVQVTVRGKNVLCHTTFFEAVHVYETLPLFVELYSLNISVVTPSADSAFVSWAQPEMSLAVAEYTVSLTQVDRNGQAPCISATNNTLSFTTMDNATSVELTDLEEFSSYTVTITATLYFESLVASSASINFDTLSAGKVLNVMV